MRGRRFASIRRRAPSRIGSSASGASFRIAAAATRIRLVKLDGSATDGRAAVAVSYAASVALRARSSRRVRFQGVRRREPNEILLVAPEKAVFPFIVIQRSRRSTFIKREIIIAFAHSSGCQFARIKWRLRKIVSSPSSRSVLSRTTILRSVSILSGSPQLRFNGELCALLDLSFGVSSLVRKMTMSICKPSDRRLV